MNDSITLTKKVVAYTNKKGEQKNTTQFTINVNGVNVRVQPVFKNDYKLLTLLAKEVK